MENLKKDGNLKMNLKMEDGILIEMEDKRNIFSIFENEIEDKL